MTETGTATHENFKFVTKAEIIGAGVGSVAGALAGLGVIFYQITPQKSEGQIQALEADTAANQTTAKDAIHSTSVYAHYTEKYTAERIAQNDQAVSTLIQHKPAQVGVAGAAGEYFGGALGGGVLCTLLIMAARRARYHRQHRTA